ncbi:unnamed protein product [Rhizophagus irregularis]|nr:unnamed protein product [Rhizophagus irregularis]
MSSSEDIGLDVIESGVQSGSKAKHYVISLLASGDIELDVLESGSRNVTAALTPEEIDRLLMNLTEVEKNFYNALLNNEQRKLFLITRSKMSVNTMKENKGREVCY